MTIFRSRRQPRIESLPHGRQRADRTTAILSQAHSQSVSAAGTTTPNAAAPTRFSVLVQGQAAGKGPDVILIPGLASSREVYAAEAKLLNSTYRLHRIQIAGFAGAPAGPNATGPLLKPIVEELHQYIASSSIYLEEAAEPIGLAFALGS